MPNVSYRAYSAGDYLTLERWQREYMADWEYIVGKTKKLKLEAGKFYRTRDGRKVGPLFDNESNAYPFASRVEWGSSFVERQEWCADGSFHFSRVEAPHDLVAEWDDTAAWAQHVADSRPTTVQGPYTVQDVVDAARRDSETELQRLVRVANEGAAAMQRLGGNDAVECRRPGRYWGPYSTCPGVIDSRELEFRLRPRPAFEPFYVGRCTRSHPHDEPCGSWKVCLSDDGKTLSVGCKQFDARDLADGIRQLQLFGGMYALTAGGTIRVMRDGLRLEAAQNHALSWPDADRILAALEKYFGAKEAA